MIASWKDVLERPRAGEHVAQVYQDPEFLLDAVSHYVASGLEKGEGVVLVMRQANWDSLQRRLEAAGADPAAAIVRGQLFRYEADAMLRSEERTSELQSPCNLVCRLLLEKKK